MRCNEDKHLIEVPEKVSSKVYQPSVPADNGVNEMRYQVARLYTALNIEVRIFIDRTLLFSWAAHFRLLATQFHAFKTMIAQFQAHQFAKEEELLREKETLMNELKPYLELNDQIRAQADRRALYIQYGILGYMCSLWGILFRLTWWEYSWDIMEPITYFITYGYVPVI